MELLEAIAKRRAIRAYTDEKVSEAKLEMILKAGCAAPVGLGLYEKMHITVIQDESLLKEISEAMKANMHTEDDPLYHASTLIVVSAAEMPFPGIEVADTACSGIVVGEKAMEVEPKELDLSIKINRV